MRLVVGVKFDDGQKVEFAEEITDFCLPPAADVIGRLVAFGQDPIPLQLSEGNRIPVRYDPADPKKVWIDEPALHEAAMTRHAEALEARRVRAEAVLDASEPQPRPHRLP